MLMSLLVARPGGLRADESTELQLAAVHLLLYLQGARRRIDDDSAHGELLVRGRNHGDRAIDVAHLHGAAGRNLAGPREGARRIRAVARARRDDETRDESADETTHMNLRHGRLREATSSLRSHPHPSFLIVTEPFTVWSRSSLPPWPIVPRSRVRAFRLFMVTGKSVCTPPFTVSASSAALSSAGASSSTEPFTVSSASGSLELTR